MKGVGEKKEGREGTRCWNRRGRKGEQRRLQNRRGKREGKEKRSGIGKEEMKEEEL